MSNPLNNVPGWRDFADDAELLAHLLTDDSRRIAADANAFGTAWAGGARISETFGPLVYEEMHGIMALHFPANAALLPTGFDFGSGATQAMLTILAEIDAEVFTPQRIAVMRSWGIATKPLWQWVGIEAEPTVEDVAAWRLDADTRLARDQIIERITAVASAIAQAETPEAVLADAEAAWSGDAE
jgi:hypothetical protein